MRKTFKREVAVGILVFLGYLAVTDSIPALEALAGPSFLFILGAFGMDAIAKQIQVGGRGRRRYYDPDSVDEVGSDSPDSDHASGGRYSDNELHRK